MNEMENSVLAFIEGELGQAIEKRVSLKSNLSYAVNWCKLHPDERVPFFLCNFCHAFKICKDDWPPYRGSASGLLTRYFRGGPDDQFFQNLDFPSIPVEWLVKMAQTKKWFHPT